PSSAGFDESDVAQRTADWLGVRLLRQVVDEQALADNFVDAAYHCEHHNVDLNYVGKHILSALPRQEGFKVVLTGEGADEAFAGSPFFPAELLREPDPSTPDLPLNEDEELRERLLASAERDLRLMARRGGLFEHSWEDGPALQA